MIECKFTYQCIDCGARHESPVLMGLDQQPPNPCAPDGWVRIQNVLYCPKHTLSLTVISHGPVTSTVPLQA